MDFNPDEAAGWGAMVRDACTLVHGLTGCDRVYTIAFGEGAQHLHLHLIPRFIRESNTTAWAVADHYRAVEEGRRSAADPDSVEALIRDARTRMI